MNKTIRILQGDDWEGLYINGVLVVEGHSVSAYDVIKALGYEYKSIYLDGDLDEWGNRCPSSWNSDLERGCVP